MLNTLLMHRYSSPAQVKKIKKQDSYSKAKSYQFFSLYFSSKNSLSRQTSKFKTEVSELKFKLVTHKSLV